MTGAPFISRSRYFKTQRIVSRSDSRLEILSFNRTPDVPYGNDFYLQERHVILTIPNGNKVIVVAFNKPNFFKNVLFKNQIIS